MNGKCPSCPMSFICLTHETRVLRCTSCKQQCVFELTKRGGVVEHGYHMMSDNFCVSEYTPSNPYHYVCFDCANKIFKRFVFHALYTGNSLNAEKEILRKRFHFWRIRLPFSEIKAATHEIPEKLRGMLLTAGKPA